MKFPCNKNLILCGNFKNYLLIIKMPAWTSTNRNIIERLKSKQIATDVPKMMGKKFGCSK